MTCNNFTAGIAPETDLGMTGPDRLTLTLVRGTPFRSHVLAYQDATGEAPFPAAPELVFPGGITWTAVLSEDNMRGRFIATAEQVAEIARHSRVWLREPASDRILATGSVTIINGPE